MSIDHYLVICPAANLAESRQRLVDAGQAEEKHKAGLFPTEFVRDADADDAVASHYCSGIHASLLADWQRILSGLPIIFEKCDLMQDKWWRSKATDRGIKKRHRLPRDISLATPRER